MRCPVLIALVLLCVLNLAARSSADVAGNWTLYPKNPVLGPGLGVIFDISVLPPTATHPYYRVYNSWRSDNQSHSVNAIGLSTSRDGLAFAIANQSIVLPPSPDPTRWDHVINRPSVLVNRTGGYTMYYTGQTSNQSFIGMAVSTDGIRWTRSADPVLSPSGAWEKTSVMCPNAVYDPALSPPWRLYYSAGEQEEPDAIGLATSMDGVKWTRSEVNPVLSSNKSAPWEADKVTGAHVFRMEGWWYAFYIGFLDVDTASINLARSRDGVRDWERHPANPLITHGSGKDWECDAVYKPYAHYEVENDRWLMWFNGRCGNVEAIGVAMKTGRALWPEDGAGVRRAQRVRKETDRELL